MQIKRIVLFLLLVVLFAAAGAQERPTLGIRLHKQIESSEPGTMISLFVEGDTLKIREAAQMYGGRYLYAHSNIARVDIPALQVREFSVSEGIRYIESGEQRAVMLTDTAVYNNNIIEIHSGDAPLTQPYKGAGVVMGIIDAGIDFNHQDFKLPNGKTRIKFLWEQVGTPNTQSPAPAPYNYGREWNYVQIDNGQCTHVEPPNQFGHGTHVAGIAAGNGSAVDNYYGMAPETDMIVVAFNFGSGTAANFVDAVDYIFKKADAMSRPCVINASLGFYYGSRDGKDLVAKIIDNLLEQRNGRVLVAAAGNAGHINYHLGYEIPQDSAFTWFRYNTTYSEVYFQMWADTAEFNNAFFSFSADDPNNSFTRVGGTQYYNMPAHFNVAGNQTGVTINQVIDNTSGGFLANIELFALEYEGAYFLEVTITGTPASYYWRFTTKGEGKIDIWSHAALMGSSDMVMTVPHDTVLPDIATYKFPDNNSTIVSSFTCSDKVIAVGNYMNRSYYINHAEDTIPTNQEPGALFGTSSRGPTRDGRVKPDITATGSTTVATGNAVNINSLLNSGINNSNKVALGGKHSTNGGTSMASPVVAGAAALYLQKNPNASYREVKDAILLSARTDTFTGVTPNFSWGYGKLNAFAALLMEMVPGCTDSTAFNYNPNANTDDGSCEPVIMGCIDTAAINYNPVANTNDGSCIAKVYGCTDTAALNYNPAANVDDGSCQYDPNTVGAIKNDEFSFAAFPNPSSGEIFITYEISPRISGSFAIRIADKLGRTVDYILLNENRATIPYKSKNLTAGMYFYSLMADGKMLGTKKMVLY